MNIDLQTIVTALLVIISGILGWLWRELWQAVQKLRADLSLLEVRIGTDYVRYDRLQDVMRPVMEALHDIRDRLDNKQDKQ
jgi:hypothetical protein